MAAVVSVCVVSSVIPGDGKGRTLRPSLKCELLAVLAQTVASLGVARQAADPARDADGQRDQAQPAGESVGEDQADSAGGVPPPCVVDAAEEHSCLRRR